MPVLCSRSLSKCPKVYIPSLAATSWVLAHLFCGAGFQGVVKVMPAEFIRPKLTKVLLCEGRDPHQSGMWGGNGPSCRATNSVYHRFCRKPHLSRAVPWRVRRMSLVDLWWEGGAGHVWGKIGGLTPSPGPHNSVCPRFCRDLASRSHEGKVDSESRGCGCCISPGWCHKKGNAPPKKDGVYSVGEWLSTENLAAVSSAFSPEQQTSVSPQANLVHSAHLLLEPKVSGCE